MAIRTFKVGLPTKHDLRKSLTMKPTRSMRQFMDHIDEHKRVEDNQTQGKGKAKAFPEKRDPRVGGYNNNRSRGDFSNQSSRTGAQMENSVFKELVYQILEKIKSEPYFKWPNKMGGDPSKRNQSIYYHYHQERGHTIEDCRTLHDHLGQLVKVEKLKQFLHQPTRQLGQPGTGYQRDGAPQLALGTINVIFATLRGDAGSYSRVMSMASNLDLGDQAQVPKRAKVVAVPTLDFSEKDKKRTFQPHDDALVVSLWIGEYDVKRVLVDQKSGVEIMYPDLYKGLNLKTQDLEKYESPLVGFDGRMVIPCGMIRLPV